MPDRDKTEENRDDGCVSVHADSGPIRGISGADPIALPTQVSSDGREVWDWADRFSRHVHRLNEMSRLRSDIAKLSLECGSCDHWMKSRQCPREHNVNGMSRGPSMGAMPCGKFTMSSSSTHLRDDWTARLGKLQSEHEQGAQS